MIAWLTGKIAGPVLGAVALALVVALGAQWLVGSTRVRDLESQRDALQGLLTAANNNIGTCHANITTLDVSLKMQGDDIRALADATAKNGADAAKAMQRLEAQGKAVRVTADQILALPRPTPEMACAEAERLLRGFP